VPKKQFVTKKSGKKQVKKMVYPKNGGHYYV